ncbi:TVP38/TMEM64 family protein [Archangium sp.]|uniref:TVP38/TMEM64 family protein n=1 Tax=Archangium sp. TaxID=1872627 RepID=UPI002D3D6FC9|nr:VTT domain-containing protein [Archangium sp.]HYO51353.1 VTT domain-containing protein [Archangium sp.]
MAGWTVLGVVLLAAILVPFFLWEERIHAATSAFLRMPHSRWLIAVALGGLLAADIVLPVPSSIVNTAAGSLLGFWAGAASSWAGLMVSVVVGYFLGWGASGTALRRLVGGNEARVSRAAARHGHWALAVFRAVPVLAEASVVLAGFNRMPFRRFLATCALSNLGLAVTYSAIGAYAVDGGSFLLAFAGAICVPAAGMFLARRLRA